MKKEGEKYVLKLGLLVWGQTGWAHMIGLKWGPKGVKEAVALFLCYDKSKAIAHA